LKKSALTEINPDQLIKDAIVEARFNQQTRREFGPLKAKKMATSMTKGGYASSPKWEDMRAQTEIHSAYNMSSQSPYPKQGPMETDRTHGPQQPLGTGTSYNQNFDDYFKSPKASDISFPTINQQHKDIGQFNSQRFI